MERHVNHCKKWRTLEDYDISTREENSENQQEEVECPEEVPSPIRERKLRSREHLRMPARYRDSIFIQ